MIDHQLKDMVESSPDGVRLQTDEQWERSQRRGKTARHCTSTIIDEKSEKIVCMQHADNKTATDMGVLCKGKACRNKALDILAKECPTIKDITSDQCASVNKSIEDHIRDYVREGAGDDDITVIQQREEE